MIRSFSAAVGLTLCLSLSAFAQSGKKSVSQGPDPDMLEINALLSAPNGGFQASGELLQNSFAIRRHWEGAETPESLSGLYAYYNDDFYFRVPTGGLYFHLAPALHRLHALGTQAAIYRATVIEIRLLWSDGKHERALEHARAFLSDTTLSDGQMVSLLTDSAILEHFLGDPELGKDQLDRARACKPQRCPDDLIFNWLHPDRRAAKDVPELFDADESLRIALENGALLFDADETVMSDIFREYDLLHGQGLHHIDKALSLAEKAAGDLTETERTFLRNMADRVLVASGFVQFLTGYQSVAQEINRRVKDGEDPRPDLDNFDYLDPGHIAIVRNLPLFYELIKHADQPADRNLADLTLARLLFSHGASDRAVQVLRRIVADARAAGATDDALFSIHADLWAMAELSGKKTIAEQAWADMAPCFTKPCEADFISAYYDALDDVPKAPADDRLIDLYLAAADRFVRREFPGDLLALADVYSGGISQTFPIDAARRAKVSFEFAEAATDITPEDLSTRATKTMDTLIYAGHYHDAFDIGQRVSLRFSREKVDQSRHNSRFFQYWARAAHRLDHPRAYEIYESAIDHTLVQDLHLDLLDTSFLDLLERDLARRTGANDTLARLRVRQGRQAEAALIVQEMRHNLFLQGQYRARVAQFYFDQARLHLKNRSLDAYLEARLKMLAAVEGDGVIDHPHVYKTESKLVDMAFQEAHYWDLAGNHTEADRLRSISGADISRNREWEPLPDIPDPNAVARFNSDNSNLYGSYDYIRDIIALRDDGNYEVAAAKMREFRWLAMAAEDNREYVDAQTLWQMAYTFARVGDSDIAFDLMNRAARIAANLSYEGAGGANGGTLQLLERDRWRYLLFIDIAWAAASGQAPEEMTVVSRY